MPKIPGVEEPSERGDPSAVREDGGFQPTPTDQFPSPPSRRDDEELRRELRKRARKDLYFLCKGILGYDKLVPHAHKALCEFLSSEEVWENVWRRMIQMPRDHFKTTIATISHTIQLILLDPEIRILLVAQSGKNAERFLQEIKNHFRRNEKLKWLFPELIPENFNKITWNKQEMEIVRDSMFREPTIDTIGSRGAVESRHYDVIKADDIIGEKEKESDAEMEKTIEWASGLESLLVQPVPTEEEEGSHIDIVGSRKTNTDVYAFLEDFWAHDEEPRKIGPHAFTRGEVAIFRRGARKGDGSGDPIFPELISKEFLDRLQEKNPERYAAQYANNPKQSGVNTFSEDWLRYWKTYSASEEDGRLVLPRQQYEPQGDPKILHERDLDIKVLYDPATGDGSSRNAMLVTGAINLGGYMHIVVLESHIGFYNTSEAITLILDINSRYQDAVFSIEEYGFQGSIKYHLRQRVESEFLPMPSMQPFPPKGVRRAQKAKDKRIEGLQPLFRNGQVWLQEGMSALIEEYMFYPNSKYRDGLDALAQGVEIWGLSWSKEREEEIAEREEEMLSRIGRSGYSEKSHAPSEKPVRTRRGLRVEG